MLTSRRQAQAQTSRCLSTVVAAEEDSARFWKNRDGHYQRPIFVAATKQHVGKTTTSLAIISGLRKRFDKVGFLKPVGQQHVEVRSENLDKTLQVDKDVWLVREHFHLDHIDYEHMSPVIIPRGYTKKYVDGKISHDQQLHDIENAMKHVNDASDVVLCEGTGHCAVGSIVNLNNAKVASSIGADMVLVANGGIGKCVMLCYVMSLLYCILLLVHVCIHVSIHGSNTSYSEQVLPLMSWS